ncbi:MAG: hypothetical protein NC548_47410 [Lachnospiraceae bacterium]|nr:hypothetical protein [Lachnospiraceae bacterium]
MIRDRYIVVSNKIAKEDEIKAKIEQEGISGYVMRILKEQGIDTSSRSKYQISTRFKDKSFVASGEWLACFGILLHGAPTPKALYDHFDVDLEDELRWYSTKYPTAKDLLEGPAEDWAFEFPVVKKFTNLSTGETYEFS